jgi:hypothetical protein
VYQYSSDRELTASYIPGASLLHAVGHGLVCPWPTAYRPLLQRWLCAVLTVLGDLSSSGASSQLCWGRVSSSAFLHQLPWDAQRRWPAGELRLAPRAGSCQVCQYLPARSPCMHAPYWHHYGTDQAQPAKNRN